MGDVREVLGIIDKLSVHIHEALRRDALEAEPLIELAGWLEESGRSTPATRELLDRPVADRTPDDLDRLARALLQDVGLGPSFTLQPALWTALEQALRVVERDVRTAGITGPLRLETPDVEISGVARVMYEDAWHGNGLEPADGQGDPQGTLATVADVTQEVIMELTWQVWPVCTAHNRGLRADVEDGLAVWRCSAAGTHTISRVGELPACP